DLHGIDFSKLPPEETIRLANLLPSLIRDIVGANEGASTASPHSEHTAGHTPPE
ncbi:MAG: hypothetical protein IT435_03440, partial [Phycisphaerales bacterium]|nr:hypothetical protein [Phycisphaerales bacterium]